MPKEIGGLNFNIILIMKLPIMCQKCIEKIENTESVDVSKIAKIEFRDDGRYEITCPNGHTSVTILQEQKFEVLFDIGTYAINDGYYREAVSSFTSSLERFYEFFIKVILLHENITTGMIDSTWKLVDSQSERQLGAFIFLYIEKFKKQPELLQNKKLKSYNATQFRNEVIHKGKIPTREEAIGYGQIIFDLIDPMIKEMKTEYQDAIDKEVFYHLNTSRSDPSEQHSTISIPTIISLNRSDPDTEKRSFEEILKTKKRWH